MEETKVLVVVPAYNEAGSIQKVIHAIQKTAPNLRVLVINDGSSDDTSQLAQAAGAEVIDMPYNVGIGVAVQTGLMYADEHRYDVVIRNDGDGQHDPEQIPQLLSAVQSDVADYIVGSRFLEKTGDYGTPWRRRLGINFLIWLIRRRTRFQITDPTSGFVALNRRAIQLFAHVYPHDYPEPEALVILHRAGLRVYEIPVNMRERAHGKSSITPIRSVYYMLKVSLAILTTSVWARREFVILEELE